MRLNIDELFLAVDVVLQNTEGHRCMVFAIEIACRAAKFGKSVFLLPMMVYTYQLKLPAEVYSRLADNDAH